MGSEFFKYQGMSARQELWSVAYLRVIYVSKFVLVQIHVRIEKKLLHLRSVANKIIKYNKNISKSLIFNVKNKFLHDNIKKN